ncbi:MAG: hypothetical protein IPH20_18465 [Bacteroidales bacterium]|nr:hypothetical protein [Bacteroidales bacterium]
MKIKPELLFAFALILTSSMLSGQIQHPDMPKIVYNVDPQQGCQFGEWKILSPLKAYTTAGDTTSVAFQLNSNEKITALRGNVHVLKPGFAILPEMTRIDAHDTSILTLKTDTVYILVRRGEGFADIWYRDRLLSSVDEMIFSGFQDPVTEWWVLIENMKKEQGWLRMLSAEKKKIYGWNIFMLN